MRNGTPLLTATQRALVMLEAVVADRGERSVSALARDAGLPVATAHRQVVTLVAEGFLVPLGGGRHIAGPRLRALAGQIDDKQLIAQIAAPYLRRLADRTGLIAQLGSLEDEMVTYRIKTGEGASAFFTRVDMQLEAYCSGIGKVLLAALPEEEQEAYLAGGPFVALTANTITEPDALARELSAVREQGYGADNGEIDPDLYCLAVPIHDADGKVPVAISVSRQQSVTPVDQDALLARMRETAGCIERAWQRAAAGLRPSASAAG